MRAELFLICLLPASLGLAAVPLASAGPLSLGDGGQDALPSRLSQGRVSRFELPFNLSTSAQVWAEAEGLQFIDQGPDAAPEAFFDDTYIGPLHPEHGSHWRGPLSPLLPAGPHKLVLRGAQVQDAEDFVLRRIFVYANGPQEKPRAQAPADPSPTASPRSLAENGCMVKQRRDWKPERKNGLVLSVLSGQVIPSGELVRLKDGEAWTCAIKVQSHSSKPLALLAGFHKQGGDSGRWLFSLDPDPAPVVEEKGFKSARWERFSVQLCAQQLTMRFGQAPPLQTRWDAPEISFEIAAQSVEIALRPMP